LSKVFVSKDQFLKRGQLIALSGASNNYGRLNYQHLHFGICRIGAGGCGNQSQTHDPSLFWLGGQPQCFDPKTDYSAYSQKDITLPVACGDYGKALIAESKGKE
jgi:murein DD-endopeptidase MepM/ murein hydrolase activator NlpD